jgi:glyoxalase/bleomycin resistance protein/dioxygenase superfamily protein
MIPSELAFHHLGVACPDLAAEMSLFKALGYRQEAGIFRDPIQKIEGVFLTGPGPRLELLAPLDVSSPVISWLEKGIKYYHQAFEVASISRSLEQMRIRNGLVVSPPEPGAAFGGRLIAFVMLPGMILIEMIQAA